MSKEKIALLAEKIDFCLNKALEEHKKAFQGKYDKKNLEESEKIEKIFSNNDMEYTDIVKKIVNEGYLKSRGIENKEEFKELQTWVKDTIDLLKDSLNGQEKSFIDFGKKLKSGLSRNLIEKYVKSSSNYEVKQIDKKILLIMIYSELGKDENFKALVTRKKDIMILNRGTMENYLFDVENSIAKIYGYSDLKEIINNEKRIELIETIKNILTGIEKYDNCVSRNIEESKNLKEIFVDSTYNYNEFIDKIRDKYYLKNRGLKDDKEIEYLKNWANEVIALLNKSLNNDKESFEKYIYKRIWIRKKFFKPIYK